MRKHLPQFLPIILLRDRLVHVLVGKHLQDQRQVVRVEQQLRHILKLQDIWCLSALPSAQPEPE